MVMRRIMILLFCLNIVGASSIYTVPENKNDTVDAAEIWKKWKTPIMMSGAVLGTMWVGKTIFDYCNPNYEQVIQDAQQLYAKWYAKLRKPVKMLRVALKKNGVKLSKIKSAEQQDITELELFWDAVDTQDEKKLAAVADTIWPHWQMVKQQLIDEDVRYLLQEQYTILTTHIGWLQAKRNRSVAHTRLLSRMQKVARNINSTIQSLDGVLDYLRQYRDYFALYAFDKKLRSKYAERLAYAAQQEKKPARVKQQKQAKQKQDTIWWDDDCAYPSSGLERDLMKLHKLMNPCYPQLHAEARKLYKLLDGISF